MTKKLEAKRVKTGKAVFSKVSFKNGVQGFI